MVEWLARSMVSELPCQGSELGPVLIRCRTWEKKLLLFWTPVRTRGMTHGTSLWVGLQCQM